MAFGLKREEMEEWKRAVKSGRIAFLTHYWFDPRFPQHKTVTKVGCCNLEKLVEWGRRYNLKPEWIDHHDKFPHFDLLGDNQYNILVAERCYEQIRRFNLSLG